MCSCWEGWIWRFQSTHPVRGATTACMVDNSNHYIISIHAPREGCDLAVIADVYPQYLFQSTHPVRGATTHGIPAHWSRMHFNPRTP